MTTRRDFLLASLLPTLVACAAGHSEAQTSATAQLGGGFDEARFNLIISKNAAHRHCLGIASVNGGQGLYAMNKIYETYEQVLKTPLDQVSLASVLYGGAPITMAFNDHIWNEILIPTIPRLNAAAHASFESVSISVGNPFLYRPANSNGGDASVESLVQRGAMFFVCNNSALELASLIANARNERPADVYQRFSTGLVRGASFVPTGVWALNALQEKHFTYIQATN